MDNELKLKRCDLNQCQAMCCYDGVYLEDGEEEKIKEIVEKYPEYFIHLPKEFIVDGNWDNLVSGRKTAVKSFNYKNESVPSHWNQTRCVFATENHLCSLQITSIEKGNHLWEFKPKSCWMHSLKEKNNELIEPPVSQKDDEYNLGIDYPGFVTFTRCGTHNVEGESWNKVLKEEINYFKKQNETKDK